MFPCGRTMVSGDWLLVGCVAVLARCRPLVHGPLASGCTANADFAAIIASEHLHQVHVDSLSFPVHNT
jgi:hypothetical protein